MTYRLGDLVRIAPHGQRRGKQGFHHYGRGRVEGVSGRMVMVKPFGHKRAERIAPEHLKLWRGKMGGK